MIEQAIEKQRLEQAFKVVADIEAGRQVLRYVMELTGYQEKLMTYNPGTSELNPQATLYNFSKRDMWLELREFITPRQRCLIENPIEEKEPHPSQAYVPSDDDWAKLVGKNEWER